jgi:hypothetical protein
MLSPVISNKKESCFRLVEKVVSQVKFEIGQIDHLLEVYVDLLERAQHRTPDLVEMAAIASVLHSFYNGLENIFLAIAKGIDAGVPTGSQWHRNLLTQMAKPTSTREPVLTIEITQRLADYLGFRHFYRHSYSFFLDWGELEKLVKTLTEVWTQTKAEIELFLNGISQ